MHRRRIGIGASGGRRGVAVVQVAADLQTDDTALDCRQPTTVQHGSQDQWLHDRLSTVHRSDDSMSNDSDGVHMVMSHGDGRWMARRLSIEKPLPSICSAPCETAAAVLCPRAVQRTTTGNHPDCSTRNATRRLQPCTPPSHSHNHCTRTHTLTLTHHAYAHRDRRRPTALSHRCRPPQPLHRPPSRPSTSLLAAADHLQPTHTLVYTSATPDRSDTGTLRRLLPQSHSSLPPLLFASPFDSPPCTSST